MESSSKPGRRPVTAAAFRSARAPGPSDDGRPACGSCRASFKPPITRRITEDGAQSAGLKLIGNLWPAAPADATNRSTERQAHGQRPGRPDQLVSVLHPLRFRPYPNTCPLACHVLLQFWGDRSMSRLTQKLCLVRVLDSYIAGTGSVPSKYSDYICIVFIFEEQQSRKRQCSNWGIRDT